jgi:hypothetical protein
MPCKKCGSNGPLAGGSSTLCKKCDSERKAAWYQRSHPGAVRRGPLDPKPKEPFIDRNAQVCQDCGELFSYHRIKKFCEACIKRHESEAREALKVDKAEYDHQYRADGRRGPKSEKEKEHNREYMREYRKGK